MKVSTPETPTKSAGEVASRNDATRCLMSVLSSHAKLK